MAFQCLKPNQAVKVEHDRMLIAKVATQLVSAIRSFLRFMHSHFNQRGVIVTPMGRVNRGNLLNPHYIVHGGRAFNSLGFLIRLVRG